MSTRTKRDTGSKKDTSSKKITSKRVLVVEEKKPITSRSARVYFLLNELF